MKGWVSITGRERNSGTVERPEMKLERSGDYGGHWMLEDSSEAPCSDHRAHAGLIDERLGRIIDRPALTAFRGQDE